MSTAHAFEVMTSSERMDWPTPPAFFQQLDREFRFALDPCASSANAKCPRYFTPADDGLAQPWAPGPVFMNPPYGRAIRHWVRKAAAEARRGVLVVGLVPARTDTRWWWESVRGAGAEVRYLRGRLRFEGSRHAAPFPSAVVIWRPGVTASCLTCGQHVARRADARYCSNGCRQRAYRRRRAA